MKTFTPTYRHAIIIAGIALIACASPFAFAQNPEANQERTENRAEIREDARIRLSENIQNRIRNLSENVTDRLTAVVERYENIFTRLDSRIAKLTSAGIDTSTAEERLADAKVLVGNAKEMIASLASIESIFSSETPRESFAQVRTEILEIRSTLRGAHQALLDTVSLLKEAVLLSEQGQGASDAVRQNDTQVSDETSETE